MTTKAKNRKAKKREAGRPRLYKNTKRLTVCMPDDILACIERRAEIEGRSLNAIAVGLFRLGLLERARCDGEKS